MADLNRDPPQSTSLQNALSNSTSNGTGELVKHYYAQRVLPPAERVGVKELGLVALGAVVETMLKIGDVSLCSEPFQLIYGVLKDLKGQQLFQDWSELRLGPIMEVPINPTSTWGDNGSSTSTSSSNAFDNKPAAWESDKNMKEALLGFKFDSPKALCMIQIKWQNDCLPRDVEVEVSNDKGYSYRSVMSVSHKAKESKTDILFSPTSGTHFTIKMKGLLGDKTIVSISRITAFVECNSHSALYVPPRKTLQQLEDWSAFVALNSPSATIRSVAIAAMGSLLVSSASISLSLRTAIALLTLESRNAAENGGSNTTVNADGLITLAQQVEYEHKRLLGNKNESQAFQFIFDSTCKHNSLLVSEDGLTVKSTDSEKAYILVNKGFTGGQAAWEFQLTEDREDDERTCFGCAIKPVTDGNYQSSNQLWMYRGYNGSLYARGSTVTTSFDKIKMGDIVRCELDMEEGTLSYLVNGVFKGVGFRDLKADLGTIYPAVCFYGKDRTIKLLSVECENEGNETEVYLSTLKEQESSVGSGTFGNNGSLGHDNKKIIVQGKLSRYGLSIHPPSNGSSYVNYILKEGEFEMFNASVAINDDVTESASDIVFEVLGDNKVLWTSPPLKLSQVVVPVSVEIAGVKLLQLRCTAKDSNSSAHAVWVDPSLRLPQPCFFDREIVKNATDSVSQSSSPKVLAGHLLALLDQFCVIQLQAMRKIVPGSDKVAMALVEPYCIDVSLHTFSLLTELLHVIAPLIGTDASPPGGSNKQHGKVMTYENMAISTINLVKANLRRLVVSRINPESIGIQLLAGSKGEEPTLRPLHNILKNFLEDGSTFSDSLGKAASAAIDAGLEVFYPTPEERRVLLENLTRSGATLEVQFRWPTEVEREKKSKKKDEVVEYDIRFERVILLLEVEFGNLGWNFMLQGNWGSFIHLVVEIPDNRSSSAIDFLDDGLKDIMGKAGFNNWSFPTGCEDPQIMLKIERYLKFNRNERLLSEAGLGWFRIYPRHSGTFDDICGEVTAFLETEESSNDCYGDGGEKKEVDTVNEEKREETKE